MTDVPSGALTVGISGWRQNAAAAAAVGGVLAGVCEQERITRVRRVGLQHHGVPHEAIDVVLSLAGGAAEIARFAVGEDEIVLTPGRPVRRFEHHCAHATTAFTLSPFADALVLVSDTHRAGGTSLWQADRTGIDRLEWPTQISLAALFDTCARILGFGAGQEHQVESIARLDDGGADENPFERLIRYRDGEIRVADEWAADVERAAAGTTTDLIWRARLAAAFQRQVGRVLVELLDDARRATGARRLALGGGLFFNTFLNTYIRQAPLFDDVFVAPNPGNAGLCAGLALAAGDVPASASLVSPFLGPSYDIEEIKRTLDNCKLSYEVLSEKQLIAATVDALQRGGLVGWFQRRMEWAHRGLGNRSILASPLAPYVLDNLNTFLKQREPYRAYGVSVIESEASRLFDGPPASRFLEYEYGVRDPATMRHVVGQRTPTLRVQTVAADEPFARFHALHEAFGAATGIPVLVNTSFNGFREPIVCTPRDAIRVFYGTGLDVLVLERFVIRK